MLMMAEIELFGLLSRRRRQKKVTLSVSQAFYLPAFAKKRNWLESILPSSYFIFSFQHSKKSYNSLKGLQCDSMSGTVKKWLQK